MDGTEDVGFKVGFTLEGSVVGFLVGLFDGVVVGTLDDGRIVGLRVGDKVTGRALEGTEELFIDGEREDVGRDDGRADGTY